MSKHETRESGSFSLLTVAVIAVVIAAAAVLLMPAHANSDASSSDTAYAGPTGYFPAEYVNQAKEVEPMPMMYE
jgi:hypothetical protein